MHEHLTLLPVFSITPEIMLSYDMCPCLNHLEDFLHATPTPSLSELICQHFYLHVFGLSFVLAY